MLAKAPLSGRGEASGIALARQILAAYAGLDAEEKLSFLKVLAEQFGSDPVRLERAIANHRSHPSAKTATALHRAAEPRRQELIRRLNLAPSGTHELVRIREDLLRHLKNGLGRPVDPAARLHLGNGARLERVNWLGDLSPKGLSQGAGFMVNYLYDPARIVENHEIFANKGEVVTSYAVRKLLRPRAKASASRPTPAPSARSGRSAAESPPHRHAVGPIPKS